MEAVWGLICWIMFGAAGAVELSLPEGDAFTAPWGTRLFLDKQRAVSEADAATFELADDPEVGRCLVVGPWLAGQWSARVQYTEFESWGALREAKPEPPLARGPMFDDLVEFERVLVKRFIDISIASVRAHDKNHLIASNRYNMGGLAEWMRTIDLCSAYDIVACNLYPQNQEAGVGRAGLQVLREVARRTGRPVLIGEWSVPAMDSGLYEERKHALDWSFPQTVPTQEVRAAQAARTAADHYNEPYMVGAHWFIYRDFDSEAREANRGLVRGDGTPYEKLTSALTSIHLSITSHFGAE